MNLTGKHVPVASAAFEDGVGYATASAFARAGASAIAMAGLHGASEKLAAKLNLAATEAGWTEPKVICCQVDIAQLKSVQAMCDKVSKAFEGRLDVLVNDSAHMGAHQPLLDTDPDIYW